MKNSILILGKPQSTKTRYMTQFSLRAEKGKSSVVLLKQPDDKTAIWEDRRRVSTGQSSKRTAGNTSEKMTLEIGIGTKEFVLSYPDSDGEQINTIIDSHRVNKAWKEDIEHSDYWVLFIRPNDLRIPYNISTKPINIKTNKTSQGDSGKLSDQNFFIELLQILLFQKEVSTREPVRVPRLAIALTCWDELGVKSGLMPRVLFEDLLPMFSQFVYSVWGPKAISVYGLSPQGKTLSDDLDDGFIDSGPTNNGYIILEDGSKDPDITKLIAQLIQ